MIKSISSALAAIAVVTFAGFTSHASAQNCSTCGPAPAISSFSWPATATPGCGHGGCGHGHIGQGVDELKQKFAHASAINGKIAARNDAWPKPFSCWDKRDYYATWAPMIQAGAEVHAVLDGNYFSQNNQLNNVGIDRVAGVVLNMPANLRTLYVNRGPDEAVNQARVSSIRNLLSTHYRQIAGVDVRLSDRIPQSVSGASIIQLQNGRIPKLPPAVLPVAAAQSVKSAVKK
ncbi:hypothetical protein N9Y42_05840 [Mariniblastus sp.]|nr:hypothetical protein [Mariniblastus sp.]